MAKWIIFRRCGYDKVQSIKYWEIIYKRCKAHTWGNDWTVDQINEFKKYTDSVKIKDPLINLPKVLDIVLNKRIISVCSNYFGYKPYLTFIKCFKSYANNLDDQEYDAILSAAAPLEVPNNLKKRLKIGGKLILPVGDSNSQVLTLVKRVTKNEFIEERLEDVLFVPLLKGVVS